MSLFFIWAVFLRVWMLPSSLKRWVSAMLCFRLCLLLLDCFCIIFYWAIALLSDGKAWSFMMLPWTPLMLYLASCMARSFCLFSSFFSLDVLLKNLPLKCCCRILGPWPLNCCQPESPSFVISMFSGPVLPWLSMDENKLVLSVVPRALGSRESFFVMLTYMLWIPWG